MAEKIVLRYPQGVVLLETDENSLAQYFINWVVNTNHFLKYEESRDYHVFTFPEKKHVSMCNVKWNKLCNNY